MAIVILNIAIIAVILLICILIFAYMSNSGNAENPAITTSMTTKAGGTTVVTTTQVTTAKPVSMTKISTTTPAPTTEDPSKTTEKSTDTEVTTTDEAVAPAVDYNKEFFADDIFIGDSITTGLYLYGKLDQSLVFAKTGLNTLSVQTDKIDGHTAQEYIAEKKPKHVYIMLGANGMAFMGNTYMLNMLKDFITQVETAAPDAKIVLLAVSPVTAEYETKNSGFLSTIKEYNLSLKELCDSKGYTYIDVFNLLLDNDGYFSAKYAEADGLHFLGNTYNALLNYIEKQLS